MAQAEVDQGENPDVVTEEKFSFASRVAARLTLYSNEGSCR